MEFFSEEKHNMHACTRTCIHTYTKLCMSWGSLREEVTNPRIKPSPRCSMTVLSGRNIFDHILISKNKSTHTHHHTCAWIIYKLYMYYSLIHTLDTHKTKTFKIVTIQFLVVSSHSPMTYSANPWGRNPALETTGTCYGVIQHPWAWPLPMPGQNYQPSERKGGTVHVRSSHGGCVMNNGECFHYNFLEGSGSWESGSRPSTKHQAKSNLSHETFWSPGHLGVASQTEIQGPVLQCTEAVDKIWDTGTSCKDPVVSSAVF